MAKHAKRKSGQKDAIPAKGNVIPLHVSRVEAAEPAARAEVARNELAKPEVVAPEPKQDASRQEPFGELASNEASKGDDPQGVPGRPRAGRRHRRSTLPPTSENAPSVTIPAPGAVPVAPAPSAAEVAAPAARAAAPNDAAQKTAAPAAPVKPAPVASASSSAAAPATSTTTSSNAAKRGSDPHDAFARDAQVDEHSEVHRFFSQPPPRYEQDVDHDTDHDTEHEHGLGSPRGKQITLTIAALGLLLIGGFLIYNKLLMPTPEELGPSPVALPTPDMLRAAPSSEPAPAEAPAPAPALDTTPAPTPEAPPAAPALESTPDPAAAEATPPAPEEVAPEAVPLREAPPGYVDALNAARKVGFRRGAEAAYQKAIALDARGTEALSGLAMLYLNQGKNLAARDRAQEAVSADAQNTEGWIVLGASLSALGDAPAARKAYQECAALEGKYANECKRMLR
jgi:hypothetical protein